MIPGRANVKGKRLTIRFYRRYSGIAIATRERIQRKLGLPRKKGGIMRQRASKHDPICVVAFRDGKAIGWAALFKPGQIHRKLREHDALQVFVQKKYRKHGIGKQLLERMVDRMKLHDGPLIDTWPITKAARRCFKSAGFKK